MSPPARVIIDTDPGVDDVLAMLFALGASADDIEVLLISVTFGNVKVQDCLRNVVAMFHVIEKEFQWRQARGLPEGFGSLRRSKPLVAVGADAPLDDELLMADYFHGVDGLGGVHSSHQHLTPPETWRELFNSSSSTLLTSTADEQGDSASALSTSLFTSSQKPSHLEILRILEENPPDTISIVAIGPLTNVALAASHSPKTLMRAKSILVMGGAVSDPGNMTPLAEFNTYADTVAAARVFALTSPNPASTMPPLPPKSDSTNNSKTISGSTLPPYPPYEELGSRRLNLILFPLDITTKQCLYRDEFEAKVKPLITSGSPLAEWTNAFLTTTFQKMETLSNKAEGHGALLDLHDPLCIWYALTGESHSNQWSLNHGEDIRVETAGQWTRGMCIIDRRDRKKEKKYDDDGTEVPGDAGGWLSSKKGNRLGRCVGTPGSRALAPYLLDNIFGRA